MAAVPVGRAQPGCMPWPPSGWSPAAPDECSTGQEEGGGRHLDTLGTTRRQLVYLQSPQPGGSSTAASRLNFRGPASHRGTCPAEGSHSAGTLPQQQRRVLAGIASPQLGDACRMGRRSAASWLGGHVQPPDNLHRRRAGPAKGCMLSCTMQAGQSQITPLDDVFTTYLHLIFISLLFSLMFALKFFSCCLRLLMKTWSR